MSDHTCGCGCSSIGRSTSAETSTGHSGDRRADGGGPAEGTESDRSNWIETDPIDISVPDDLQTAMEQFLGGTSVETIGEFFGELRSELGRESLDVDDLCHAGEETPHWGVLDGERYHFQCFYDAVALAEMTDSETTVRTESPAGVEITGTASGSGEFGVTPAGAVMSFGIQTEIDEPVETVEDAYAAICPSVKGFPSREAYEQWAAEVPAATVAMPMADGTDLARLVAE